MEGIVAQDEQESFVCDYLRRDGLLLLSLLSSNNVADSTTNRLLGLLFLNFIASNHQRSPTLLHNKCFNFDHHIVTTKMPTCQRRESCRRCISRNRRRFTLGVAVPKKTHKKVYAKPKVKADFRECSPNRSSKTSPILNTSFHNGEFVLYDSVPVDFEKYVCELKSPFKTSNQNNKEKHQVIGFNSPLFSPNSKKKITVSKKCL